MSKQALFAYPSFQGDTARLGTRGTWQQQHLGYVDHLRCRSITLAARRSIRLVTKPETAHNVFLDDLLGTRSLYPLLLSLLS